MNNNFWAADPFLVSENGVVYLFFERYDRTRKRGELAVAVVNENLSITDAECIISRPYHLSFPNVFKYKNQYYIIPETQSNHTIEIYKAVNFPYKWELHKTILNNISAVDTIILNKDDDGLILHTSVAELDSCNVENWMIQLDNAFNVLGSKKIKDFSEYGNRNGGSLVSENGFLYRIGQDCRNGEYGKGLVIYKTDGISEKEVRYCGLEQFGVMDSKYSGIHTYNSCALMEVIDLRYFRKRNFLEKLIFIMRLGGNYVKRRIRR